MIDKRCTKCGHRKPATTEFFGPDKRNSDLLKGQCRECVNAYMQHYVKVKKCKDQCRAYRNTVGSHCQWPHCSRCRYNYNLLRLTAKEIRRDKRRLDRDKKKAEEQKLKKAVEQKRKKAEELQAEREYIKWVEEQEKINRKKRKDFT